MDAQEFCLGLFSNNFTTMESYFGIFIAAIANGIVPNYCLVRMDSELVTH
jgi:hypothetical protein